MGSSTLSKIYYNLVELIGKLLSGNNFFSLGNTPLFRRKTVFVFKFGNFQKRLASMTEIVSFLAKFENMCIIFRSLSKWECLYVVWLAWIAEFQFYLDATDGARGRRECDSMGKSLGMKQCCCQGETWNAFCGR